MKKLYFIFTVATVVTMAMTAASTNDSDINSDDNNTYISSSDINTSLKYANETAKPLYSYNADITADDNDELR